MTKLEADSIAKYHSQKRADLGYLRQTTPANCSYVIDDELSFSGVLRHPYKMPHVPWPRIETPTLLGQVHKLGAQALRDAMLADNPSLMLLVESYNKELLRLVELLNLDATDYVNSKCMLELSSTKESSSINNKKIDIRLFHPERDAETYVQLYNESLGHLGSVIDIEFLENEIIARPTFDPNGYFIAEIDKTPVGILSVERLTSEIAYIYQCGVIPAAQGKGIASALLEKCLEFARKAKSKEFG